MARYHVVFADPADNGIYGAVVRASDPVTATLLHPWIAGIYLPSYIAANFTANTAEDCAQKIFDQLGWLVLCTDLDEAIMSALNGGDSSASSAMQQD